MKHIKRLLFTCMACTIFFVQSMSVSYAEDIHYVSPDEELIDLENFNLPDSFEVNYTENNDTISEITSFTDIDGTIVKFIRTVNNHDYGELKTYYDDCLDSSITLDNLDYDLFLKQMKTSNRPRVLRGPTMGKDITGSQFKHVYIGSNMFTYKKPSSVGSLAVAPIAKLALTALGISSNYAVAIAEFIYAEIVDHSADKVVVNQSAYEVLFSYDNNYYIHCYHEVIKSYDSGGHLIDTTKAYKQAYGG